MLDRDLRILAHNAVFAEMTGLRPRELRRRLEAGAVVTDLLGRGAGDDEASVRIVVEHGRALRFDEVSVTNAAKERFNSILTFIPIVNDAAEVIGVLQQFRDVTAEAAVQSRYRQLLALERARAGELERQVEARTLELQAALVEVTRLSRRDSLTGLLTRRAFMEQAEQALELAGRHQRCASLLMFDLDHFKRLNDLYGHQTGDAVLVAAAKSLMTGLRTSDSLGRYGGEEFIALLAETSLDHVKHVAERCRHFVRNVPIAEMTDGGERPLTVSIGVAVFPRDGTSLERLVARADEALYHAKQSGRDCVVEYHHMPADRQTEAKVKVDDRLRVLVACSEDETADLIRRALGQQAVIEIIDNAESVLTTCQSGDFDVIIADQVVGEWEGIGLLYSTLAVAPRSLRLMVIDDADTYVALRGRTVASVDRFLLRDEVAEHLLGAIEDGLLRQDFTWAQRSPTVLTRTPIVPNVAQLDRIIEGRELEIVYQPIVYAESREVFGFEAICRCREAPFQNSSVLFAAALHLGRIWSVSRLVRAMAVEALPRFPKGTLLFIDLHPADLNDPEFLRGEPFLLEWASRVVFEVTERAAMPDLDLLQENLVALRDIGYRFAIDDLGSGYASLNSLSLLNPAFVKIDAKMIRNQTKRSTPLKLIRRIVDFANETGIKVIVEGLETSLEAQTAVEIGCHLAQGFFFARPGPIGPSAG